MLNTRHGLRSSIFGRQWGGRRRCQLCVCSVQQQQAALSSPPAVTANQLNPRQRRLQAKRRLKDEKRAQQQQQQQQRSPQQQAASSDTVGSANRQSPPRPHINQLQSQLPPELQQLLQDLVQQARASRSYSQLQLQQAQPAVAAAAARLWGQRSSLSPQQLADLTWALSHFDISSRQLLSGVSGGGLRVQATASTQPVPPQVSLPAPYESTAAAAATAQTQQSGTQQPVSLQAPDTAAAAAAAAVQPQQLATQKPASPSAPNTAAAAAACQIQQLAAACRTAMGVPFQVLPQLLPGLSLSPLVTEVELRQDHIYLDGGSRLVPEPRLTGWQSDVGATFCYSGKEMEPQGPLTPLVALVRDRLEAITGQHYDSVLINYYPDGKCGMRFHVDPLYGVWTPHTAVVSIGDCRTFIFRGIQDHAQRWVYEVANGDVVVMFGDCQEVLQHAIKVEREAGDAGPRMSLVYKQNIAASDARATASAQ